MELRQTTAEALEYEPSWSSGLLLRWDWGEVADCLVLGALCATFWRWLAADLLFATHVASLSLVIRHDVSLGRNRFKTHPCYALLGLCGILGLTHHGCAAGVYSAVTWS